MRRSKAPPLGRNFVANPLPSPTPIPYRGGWGITLIGALRLRRLRLGVTRGVGAAMASCTWSDEETFVLIEIWGEDSIQAMLEGTRRNKDVFVKIAKAIEERGFLRAILYTYYGIPLRMRKYTHSAPFYVGNPFGL